MSSSKSFWFLLIIFTSFLIGIWLENDSSIFYDNYVAPIINFKIPLIFTIVSAAAVYKYYDNKITNYESSIYNYEQQIKDGSRALWKYFKDIGEIKTKEIINDVMKRTLKGNENILAIQIYEYSFRHLRDNTSLYVEHKYSSVSAETDINALLQTHYRVPKDLYDDYTEALEILNGPVLMEEGIDSVTDWCKVQLETITDGSLEDLTEIDSIRYSLIEIILDILSFKLNDNFSHDPGSRKKNKIKWS